MDCARPGGRARYQPDARARVGRSGQSDRDPSWPDARRRTVVRASGWYETGGSGGRTGGRTLARASGWYEAGGSGGRTGGRTLARASGWYEAGGRTLVRASRWHDACAVQSLCARNPLKDERKRADDESEEPPMTKTIHGRTIELDEDLGVADGQDAPDPATDVAGSPGAGLVANVDPPGGRRQVLMGPANPRSRGREPG